MGKGKAMLAAAAVLAAVSATQAGANPFGAPFKVTPAKISIRADIKDSQEVPARGNGSNAIRFSGKVSSSKRCRRNRQVLLYYKPGLRKGRAPASARRTPNGFFLIGEGRTRRNGGWAILFDEAYIYPGDRFMARVTRKRPIRARCGQARSKVIEPVTFKEF